MSDSGNNNSFEILGQRIPLPTATPGVIAWVFICLTVGWVIYVLAVLLPESRFDKLVGAFQAHYYNSQGETVESPKRKLLSFWTPSENTKESIERNTTHPLTQEELWQDVTVKKVDDFANKLVGLGVHGWRRCRVSGKGRELYKEGWWWTLTVDSDFDTPALVRAYADHWGNTKSQIYIEEISGSVGFRQPSKQ